MEKENEKLFYNSSAILPVSLLFLFLLLKYFIFSEYFNAHTYWLGLDQIFSNSYTIIRFLLSIAHVLFYSIAVFKLQKSYSGNFLFFTLIISDPFFIISFYTINSLLAVIAFEVLIILCDKINHIIRNICLIILCVFSSILDLNLIYGLLPFVVFIICMESYKKGGVKQAKTTYTCGIISIATGILYNLIFNRYNFTIALKPSFVSFFNKFSQNGTLIIASLLWLVIVAIEVFFWGEQILSANKAKVKNKNKNSKNNKRNFKENNVNIIYISGISACLMPLIGFFITSNYCSFSTITLSLYCCMFACYKIAPNKINRIIGLKSVPVALMVLLISSFITKEFFLKSELLNVLNDFAPK